MRSTILSQAFILILLCAIMILPGCSEGKWDIDEQGIPKFVETDYIELGKISRISKLRSSEGHDYSDSYEQCRSMKHYFMPEEYIDWSTIKIYSPVAGTIKKVDEEWAGTQLHIESTEYPAFRFVIFHLNKAKEYSVGDKVAEGEELGTHIGSQTMSDIAVRVNEGINKNRLVSYFDVMTDNLFIEYKHRGVSGREDLIISKSARDADPVSCNGETFTNAGTIENWFYLQ